MAQTATITSIKREFNLFPNIVGIVTTADLTDITTADYWVNESDNVEALNNGEWQWEPEDLVLIYYATAQIGFFTFDSSSQSFVALPPNGGISDTLPSGEIIVGNVSNVATAVPMSGDVAIDNTGETTIQAGAVTGSKIANNAVDYAQIALDVAATVTVPLTAAQIKSMYTTPVQIIPAPGANKLIVVESIVWSITYGSVAFADGGEIVAEYGNVANGTGFVAATNIDAATLIAVVSTAFLSQNAAALAAPRSSCINNAIYLSNKTADFTAGDSTANLYIKYRVITPS